MFSIPIARRSSFFAVHDRSPARYKRAWSMFNDLGGWDRTEIDIDGDDRASWIENCSPCPESVFQMARTGVAGLARDLQHYSMHICFCHLVLAVFMKSCHKVSTWLKAESWGSAVPSLPATRRCGEALQECYQAADWLLEIFWCQSSVLQTLLWQCAGSQQTQNWKRRKHGFTWSSQFRAESFAVCGDCGVSRP